jgi:uncharacterized FlaG/YvyC family protein
MEIVQTIASTAAAQQTVLARLAPAPAPVAQAVQTDLSGAKAVTATNTAGTARNDLQRNPDDLQHVVSIDPATREVIFRIIDVRSRQVIRQVPEQALLRMQAYNRALNSGKSSAEALATANFEA